MRFVPNLTVMDGRAHFSPQNSPHFLSGGRIAAQQRSALNAARLKLLKSAVTFSVANEKHWMAGRRYAKEACLEFYISR